MFCIKINPKNKKKNYMHIEDEEFCFLNKFYK